MPRELSLLRPVGLLSHRGGNVSPSLETDAIVDDALDCHRRGIGRYSVVTSGRSLTAEETKDLCQSYRIVKCQCGISLCASHGLLTKEQFQQLKAAGVARYHCNLETSRRFFSQICTTHTYDDKIAALRAAASAGLELCSGGIFGMGETMEDRIDMAFDLRAMGIGVGTDESFEPHWGNAYGGPSRPDQ